MKMTLFGVPLLVLVSCASAPSPEAEATSHVKPVINALQAYHHNFGDYPQRLDELRQGYLATGTQVYDNSDARHSWSLMYQRIDRNNYTLYLDSTPCSQSVFKNGAFTGGYGPIFN